MGLPAKNRQPHNQQQIFISAGAKNHPQGHSLRSYCPAPRRFAMLGVGSNFFISAGAENHGAAFAALIASAPRRFAVLSGKYDFFTSPFGEKSYLPTSFRQTVRRRQVSHINTNHCLTQTTRRIRNSHRIIKLSRSLHNRAGTSLRVA